ncbi:MAG: SprT family zinc-dependent metalloprotease [Verrucomicrobiota bacterium]|jgi:predicted metal-dependent hydrolase
MQLDFLFTPFKRGGQLKDVIQICAQTVPIKFVRNRTARRYIIRVQPDGSIRATVPRVGSLREARLFAERHTDWIAQQLEKRQAQPGQSTTWQDGTEILYRGEKLKLSVSPNQQGPVARFGDQTVHVAGAANIRTAIERHLRQLATVELTAQTLALAKLHGLTIARITVRSQRSRWGSCSRRGTISLNWRLVQMPVAVRDYIIIHELMHRRQMNHSPGFWREIAAVCPDYRQAKAWVRQHRGLLQ